MKLNKVCIKAYSRLFIELSIHHERRSRDYAFISLRQDTDDSKSFGGKIILTCRDCKYVLRFRIRSFMKHRIRTYGINCNDNEKLNRLYKHPTRRGLIMTCVSRVSDAFLSRHRVSRGRVPAQCTITADVAFRIGYSNRSQSPRSAD